MSRRTFGLLGKSRAHLAAAGENYAEHLRFAVAVGTHMVAAGTACLIHALIPALCEDKASTAVRRLHAVLDDRRQAATLLRDGEAAGLLTLLVLSAAVACLPWLMQAPAVPSLSLSLIALAFPVAALRSLGDDLPGNANLADVMDRLRDDRSPRRPVVAAPAEPGGEIVIIGGGFSGTALALQLARRKGPRVTLVERRGDYARGAAYSARSPSHLLNVPAARMSAFPAEPDGFRHWLEARGLGTAADFAPRRAYGEYLEDLLVDALAESAGRLRLVAADAVDVEQGDGRRQVVLGDGRRLPADAVVLALGNLAPEPPAWLPDGLADGLFVPDPWASRLAAGLPRDGAVLLIGTGLTMIDAVLTLQDAGFEGRMIALSRRGLVPRAHADAPHSPAEFRATPEGPLSHRLRRFRTRAGRIGWHAAMDELRSLIQDLWRATAPAERERFLRHLRPWWDVHRHRAAPAVARRITRLRETGRLQIHAGRIVGAQAVEQRIRLFWRPRGLDDLLPLEADRIVNCSGPNIGLAETSDRLLRKLLDKGMVRPDRLGLGMEVDEHCRTVGADGAPVETMFALGPLTRGRFWEITAVPDIRVQAEELALRLVQHGRVAAAGQPG
ncbi:MAG: DUF6356 family protein [Allosphingosinicella sp.]